MAEHGLRGRELARLIAAGKPPHPRLKSPASVGDVESLIAAWDPYIKKAAARVAFTLEGSLDDAEDFAQHARLALVRVAQRRASSSEFYVRRVIRNALRGAARAASTRGLVRRNEGVRRHASGSQQR